MPRGKGQQRNKVHCRLPSCGKIFLSCKEDNGERTCSDKCRKAWNRLIGGDDDSRQQDAVTDSPNAVYRVLLDGRHVATKPTREEAERAIAGWLEEFDGDFTIVHVQTLRKKNRAHRQLHGPAEKSA